MPSYVYAREEMPAQRLTDATGLVPTGPLAALPVVEHAWTFVSTLTADEKSVLDEFMTNHGFVYVETLP